MREPIENQLALMKHFALALGTCLYSFVAVSQCPDGLTRILPEKSPSVYDAYGKSAAIQGEFAIVGSPRNDSLGHNSGLVYIYKLNAGLWKRHGVLVPPEPQAWGGFGWSVDMNEDYIVISSVDEVMQAENAGKVYVYRKPTSGWSSGLNPVAELKPENSKRVGWSVKLHPSGNAIVAGDIGESIPDGQWNRYIGAAYVFSKPGSEWSNAAPYVKLTPDINEPHTHFGFKVDFDGEYVFIGSEYFRSGTGSISVYKFNPLWTSFQRMARLHSSLTPGYASNLGSYFSAGHSRVVAMTSVYQGGIQLHVFEKGSEWGQSETESYRVQLETGDASANPMNVVQTNDQIFAVASIRGVTDQLYVLKQSGDTFNNALKQTFTLEERTSLLWGNFGAGMATDGVYLMVSDAYDNRLQRAAGTVFVLPVEPVLQPDFRQYVHDRIETTTDHQFGQDIYVKDNFLFVGAALDGHNAALGAVSIYEKNGGQWIFRKKISPPFEITPDSRFGHAIAANDNYLIIGAGLYNYDGAVFVYKRKSDWADLEHVQTIRSSSSGGKNYILDHDVAIAGNTLVIASHESSEFKSTALVYELEGSQFQLSQSLPLGNSGAAHRGELTFSFNEGTLAIGCITSNGGGNALPGNVFFFEKDQIGNWAIISTVYPLNGSTNAFASRIKLTDTHLFVSDCAYPTGGVWGSGAVFVYKKPDGGWANTPAVYNPVGIISAEIPLEGDLFGRDFDVSGNVLVAGAPQTEILLNPVRENGNAGNAYVIQALDFNWSSTRQISRYEGIFQDQADKFGSRIKVEGRELMIGAYQESQPDATHSGAVYTLTLPPTVEPVRPVCEGSSVIQLQGYPSGGLWEGTGITDASLALFDPNVAGPGIHKISYKIAGCNGETQTDVIVATTPILSWSANPPVFCSETDNDILLQINASGNENTYTWFYQSGANQVENLLSTVGSSHSANLPGIYRVNVANPYCPAASAFKVLDLEENPITAPEFVNICNDATPVALQVTPTDGIWSGPVVESSGVLNPAGVAPGQYSIDYAYDTPNGCTFSKKITLLIEELDTPQLSPSGNFCDSDAIPIGIDNHQPGYYRYYYDPPDAAPRIVAEGQNLFSSLAPSVGTYFVTVANGSCTREGNTIRLEPAQRKIEVNPGADEIAQICFGTTIEMQVNNRKFNETYQWFFKPTIEDIPQQQNQESSLLSVDRTGFYMVEATSPFCSGTSDWKYFSFSPPDSLFIPNVFTPNGDNTNETFMVWFDQETNYTDFNLEIFNRYGEKIFATSNTSGWTGRDEPSGVYYWMLSYRSCRNESVIKKGWVHLVK